MNTLSPPQPGIDRQSAAPMYDQLKQLIIDGIVRDRLGPGDLLPGEHRMCQQYGISRTVVRQALAQLEHEGVVERVKGKGTFVARPKTAESLVHTLAGLFEEARRRGGHVHSQILRHERVPATTEIATALQVAPGETVVELERLRFIDDEPWSLTTTWMPEPIGAITFDVEMGDVSLYAILAGEGWHAVRGMRSAEATIASPEQSRLLRMSPGSALLLLRSTSYDSNDRPLEHFVAFHRGDRSRFEFELRATESTTELVHVPDEGSLVTATTRAQAR